MKIGTSRLPGIAALAPMAGVADRAFRETCVKFSARYTVSEMVSSLGISYQNEKTLKLLEISSNERPCGIQLFGNNPVKMAEAAEFSMKYAPDFIDINMGCPAPKITKNGYGSAMMKTPELCGEVVSAVKRVAQVPVTVKLRKGFNNESVNAVEVAIICEQAGAEAITVHGRTREQMYRPPVDLGIIAQVKKAVSIPVVGNGDIRCGEDAVKMLSETGCDYVMVGRGALGNPFIFREINSLVQASKVVEKPTLEERLEVMQGHVAAICAYKGERYGMREARRHIGYYIKGIAGASSFRDKAYRIENLKDFEKLCNEITCAVRV